jgi:hypothetical protein
MKRTDKPAKIRLAVLPHLCIICDSQFWWKRLWRRKIRVRGFYGYRKIWICRKCAPTQEMANKIK